MIFLHLLFAFVSPPQIKMSCTASSGLDRSFLVMIKEIERGYQHLLKQHRLRIEKWIEKLVTSSVENLVWRKHRNEYAKLLLHMVILKRLSEPFHKVPPDGPLAQFPKHLTQYRMKDKASDAHELTFWREIYQRLAEKQQANESYSVFKPDESMESHYSFSVKDTHNDRELKYLKLCDGEHKIRIELLEQQLKDEKLHYGLQVQRLEFAHKAEVTAYAEAIASTSIYSNKSFNQSMPSPSIIAHEKEQEHSGYISQQSFSMPTPGTYSDTELNQSRDQSFTSGIQLQQNHQNRSFQAYRNNRTSPERPISHPFMNTEIRKVYEPPLHRQEHSPSQESRKGNSAVKFKSNEKLLGSTSLYSTSDSTTLQAPGNIPMTIRNPHGVSRLGQSNGARGNGDYSGLEGINHNQNGFESISRNSSSNRIKDNGLSTTSASRLSHRDNSITVDLSMADFRPTKVVQIKQNDDDFLAYIEEFQTEISKLQASSPLRKIRA